MENARRPRARDRNIDSEFFSLFSLAFPGCPFAYSPRIPPFFPMTVSRRATSLLSLPFALGLCIGIAGTGVAAGVSMGFPFPLGLRRMARSEGAVAWAWAANGVASVLGASAAILLAMEFGGRGVLLAGSACYLVAGVLAEGHLPRPSRELCE